MTLWDMIKQVGLPYLLYLYLDSRFNDHYDDFPKLLSLLRFIGQLLKKLWISVRP